MFDIGGTELLLIAIVALIVVGPKDLPGMFRTVGQFMGKARRMAREFSNAMNAAADEAGVKDVSETFRAAANPAKFGMDKVKDATDLALGPETQALSEKRKEQADKIRKKAAEMAEARLAKEAELADGASAPNAPLQEGTVPAPEVEPAPVKKDEA